MSKACMSFVIRWNGAAPIDCYVMRSARMSYARRPTDPDVRAWKTHKAAATALKKLVPSFAAECVVEEVLSPALNLNASLRRRLALVSSSLAPRLAPPPDLVLAEVRWVAGRADWWVQSAAGEWYFLRPDSSAPWMPSRSGPV